MRKIALSLSALGLFVFVASEVRAQQFGTGQTIGGGSTTSGVFGQTQRGGVSSRQQSGFSRGTGGGGGAGAGTAGASGSPLANLGGADAMLSGRQQQQGAFVGRGAEDLQRFIGAAAAQSQGQGRGQAQNFGAGFGGNQGGRGPNGQFGEGFDNQAAEQVQEFRRFRTKLSLGFAPPAARATAFTAISSSRLKKTLGRSVGAAVQVQLADEVVVLTGTVPTTAERTLAEQLALLEPGVARVQNEIVVAADTPAAR